MWRLKPYMAEREKEEGNSSNPHEVRAHERSYKKERQFEFYSGVRLKKFELPSFLVSLLLP